MVTVATPRVHLKSPVIFEHQVGEVVPARGDGTLPAGPGVHGYRCAIAEWRWRGC